MPPSGKHFHINFTIPLNATVKEGLFVFKILGLEDEALLVRSDAHFFLDHGLNLINGSREYKSSGKIYTRHNLYFDWTTD